MGYRPQGANKDTPSLTLYGKWLREAGFETGQQVSVKAMEGCIVLMAYEKLLAELKKTQLKLKGIEAAVSAVH